MALNIYLDEAATQPVSATEYFIGNGSAQAFTLTKFAGSAVSSVYKETRVSLPNAVVVDGVVTVTTTMTTNQYRGYTAYHQVGAGGEMVYRGYVASNDNVNTITLYTQGLNYSGGSDTLVLIKYEKQSSITDYSITGNVISFGTAPASGSNIYAVGSTPINLNLGGDVAIGDEVNADIKLYLKRDAGFVYGDIQIASDNLSQTPQVSTYVDATTAAGVITLGTGTFNAVNSEVGKVVNVNGVYVDVIVSNTTTTATLEYNTFSSSDTGAVYTIYTVGGLYIASDNAGVPANTRLVLQGGIGNIPVTIDTDTVYPFWVRTGLLIPATATNYAENVIKVSATEYIE